MDEKTKDQYNLAFDMDEMFREKVKEWQNQNKRDYHLKNRDDIYK